MNYSVEISPLAEEHIKFFKKSGQKIILKKIEKLIGELEIHPFEGTDKPEALNMRIQESGLAELTKNID